MTMCSHGFTYHHSPTVLEVQDVVREYFAGLGIGLQSDTSEKNIRALMFECFRTERFKSAYKGLALSVAREAGIREHELVFQSTPTPRVLRPGEHGTSFHCDYWYGHGENFLTVWTPLSKVVPGNTFKMIRDPARSEYHYNRIADARGRLEGLADVDEDCFDVLPKDSECAVFGSKALHGSPKNTADCERISFDFRLGPANDSSSTKDLDTYYKYMNGEHRIFEYDSNCRYLKYICGGRGISTTAQHILIEGVSKNLGLNIVAQEAEMERYGFPMLLMHAVANASEESAFDGIIIASESLLDSQTTSELNELKANVYFALENKWL